VSSERRVIVLSRIVGAVIVCLYIGTAIAHGILESLVQVTLWLWLAWWAITNMGGIMMGVMGVTKDTSKPAKKRGA